MITLIVVRLAPAVLIVAAAWAVFAFVATAALAVLVAFRDGSLVRWVETGDLPARAEGMPREFPGCGKDAVVLLGVLIGAAVAAWVVLR